MLQKALVLVFAVASIAICVSCGSTANHYVYATLPAANQVIAYREDPNSGVLTLISGSPYPAGDGAFSLVLHPSGKFLYVANPGQNENDISLFAIASDGVLTEVPPRTPIAHVGSASQPKLLVMDTAGGFLYVANAGSNNISSFSIDSSTGKLTPVAGSPFFLGFSPTTMQLAPSGNFLYVSGASTPLGLIAGYSVSAGVLQRVSDTPTDTSNPQALAIDPTGGFLYAANLGSSGSSISIFTIDSSGGLKEVQGSPLANIYSNPVALMLDSTGQYLYVANQGSNNVAVYSIVSGLPVALTTSTSTFAFVTHTEPSFLAADPSGKYLFVGSQGSSAGIQAFGVNSGNLNPLSTYNVGNTPTSIAVLK
jgi:6-phosphogluconolactonase (cycloisomerase 2 family)